MTVFDGKFAKHEQQNCTPSLWHSANRSHSARPDCPQTLPHFPSRKSKNRHGTKHNPHLQLLNSKYQRQVILEYSFLQDTQHAQDVDEQFGNGSTLVLINFGLFDAQFITHLSGALDKPVFQKGAAFVFKHQALTPESESKLRVFSPFLKIPDINLTDAYTIVQTRNHTDSMIGMDTVKLCQREGLGTLYEQLFYQLDEKFTVMQKEVNAAHKDQHHLVEVAASFSPPSNKPEHGTAHSKHPVGIIAAATGLVPRNLVEEAACSVLSFFIPCTDTKHLGANVDHVMATQKHIHVVLEGVQTKVGKGFVYSGKRKKDNTGMCTKNNGISPWSIKTPLIGNT